jgi:hypothetical protein
MAMGFSAVVSSAGKGTGAISRGALGVDGPAATVKASTAVAGAATDVSGAAATAAEATAALGAGLRAAIGDNGFDSGFIADAIAGVALYPDPDCGAGASMTTGLGLAGAACVTTAGLRSLACISNRRAASRVRKYPAAYTASTVAQLAATKSLEIFPVPRPVSMPLIVRGAERESARTADRSAITSVS